MTRIRGALVAIAVLFVVMPTFAQGPERDRVRELFGPLLDQPRYQEALKWDCLPNTSVGALLRRSLNLAGTTDEFVATWPVEYEKNQSGSRGGPKPDDGTILAFRSKQDSKFSLMSDAITELDMAVVNAQAAKNWAAWHLLARSYLRVSASVPDYRDLLGIAQPEAQTLLNLRIKAHRGVRQLQEHWQEFLASPAALGNAVRVPFDKARSAIAEHEAKLVQIDQQLADDWSGHQRDSELWMDWRAYLAAEVIPDRHWFADLAVIGLSGTDERTNTRGGKFMVYRRPLVAWPYVLAERLGLGTLTLSYDALGFDSKEPLSPRTPNLTPRIRLHGGFKPTGLPEVQALDLRLWGDPFDLATEARNRAPAGWADGTADPLPAGYRKVTTHNATKPNPPANPNPMQVAEAAKAAEAQNLADAVKNWLDELTASNQQGPAAAGLLHDKWRQEVGAKWLAEISYLQSRRKHSAKLTAKHTEFGAIVGGTSAGHATSASDLARWNGVAGNTAAIREVILRNMQADMKGALERHLGRRASAKDDAFRKCSEQLDLVRDVVQANGGNLALVRRPEEVLFAATQETFREWSLHLASMLPDPPDWADFHRHPWPERFAPELLARPWVVRESVRPLSRELDRLLLAKVAGGDQELARLLGELAVGLEPVANFSERERSPGGAGSYRLATLGYEITVPLPGADFRRADFVVADELRKAYAEVDRLLFLDVARDPSTLPWVVRLCAGGDRLLLLKELKQVDEYLVRVNTRYGQQDDYGIAQLFLASTERRAIERPFRPTNLVRWYWRAANRGVAHAQYLLGECYEQGFGVTHDPEAAFEMFSEAAAQGHPWALTKLANYYRSGFGDAVTPLVVVQTYKKAIDRGSVDAMVRLAEVYEWGLAGVAVNPDLAEEWYARAIKAGSDDDRLRARATAPPSSPPKSK